VTDVSLDLIANSPLKLKSLNILQTSVTEEKITEFSSSCFIQHLWISTSNRERDSVSLRKSVLPSLEDPDPEIQELGIWSLVDILERRKEQGEETLLPFRMRSSFAFSFHFFHPIR
jgi:hypothetical protein